MLEDPSYSQVVRWGDEGDSFVVLENERFTKSILPKHFKHSNFASFVRQLNKYDFHKVRHNNEDTGQSPYGPGAWEFKHPEFKANNKDSLDNIRRKAPAPRKTNAQGGEEAMPTQQMDLVNSQLVATQQQLEQLQQRYNEMSIHQSMLVQELIGVQKTVLNHEHVMQNVMNYLHSVDARQRRDSKIGGPFAEGNENHVPQANVDQAQQQISPLEDEPASPLQNASKLLNDLNADAQLNYKNLEHMSDIHSRVNGVMSTPPPDSASRNGHPRAPTSAGSSTTMSYAKLQPDRDAIVYPVGHTQGIDPMYSEHINNIPYPMPTKDQDGPEARRPAIEGRKKSSQVDPGWERPPQILLVEDDPTCRRIGSKFLYSFQCAIDSAFDGLEAVNKMNAGSKYDMVLMDIIMPNLDGVSACHLIRQFDNTPIIAMTSNIRSDDISMYFQHGMNDVLPKPFTKEGLLSMLEKHLGHLKKLPNGMEAMGPHSASSIPQSAAQSLKDESSPNQSPSTISTWQSPGQFSGISPTTTGPNMFMQPMHHGAGYAMDPSQMQFQQPQTPLGVPRQAVHRRQISDVTAGDELNNDAKRQRMFAQQNAMALNQVQRARPGQSLTTDLASLALPPTMPPKPQKAKGKQKPQEEQREESLQAVCLLPLANTPLIEYTLEFLASSGVEDVFIYCGLHTEQVEDYINSSRWKLPTSPYKTLVILKSDATSVGDAMRDIDNRDLITGDFLLVAGDVVSNISVEPALIRHRQRREKDKNAIMTMVLREADINHTSRPQSRKPVFVINPMTDRCLHYEEVHASGSGGRHVNLDPDLLSEQAEIEIREDLIDCYIDICTPDVLGLWSDNFDYQSVRTSFLYGVLKDYELNGKTIHTHIVADQYAARVRSLRAYDAVSKDIMGRLAYPLCPDSNRVPGQNYYYSKKGTYEESGVSKARSCMISSRCILGQDTIVGDGATVRDSILGRRCQVGKNTVIEDSYLWDGVTVGDGSIIRKAIIAQGAVIGKNCTVESGALISYDVRIADLTKISGFRRITRANHEGKAAQDLTSKSIVGEGGDGYEYSGGSDSDADSSDSSNLIYRNAKASGSVSSVSTLHSEGSDFEPVEDRTRRASFISETSEDSAPNRDFHLEATASILDGLQKEDLPENIFLELNAFRMTVDASQHEIRRAVVAAFVKRITNLEHSGTAMTEAVTRVLTRYKAVVERTIFDQESNDKPDQVDFLLCLQKELTSREKGDTLMLHMAKELYDLELVEEDGVMQWWTSKQSNEGSMGKIRGPTQQLIAFLEQAEEESESDDDEEDEDEE
ncbi:MAG: hypothetical protein Q9228_001245 [Teloschistes exilis]